MPSSALVHAACFAVGAIVGGGAVAAASLSRKRDTTIPAVTKSTPVVELGRGGNLDIAKTAQNLVEAEGILKYGNPGKAFRRGHKLLIEKIIDPCFQALFPTY